MDSLKPLSLSVGDTGRVLGVGRTKVMSLVRSGRLAAVVFDKRIHVTTASIETLHAALPGYRPGQMLDLHPRNPLPKRRARRARKLPGQRAGGNRSNLKDAQK
jgi:hypothetical protein